MEEYGCQNRGYSEPLQGLQNVSYHHRKSSPRLSRAAHAKATRTDRGCASSTSPSSVHSPLFPWFRIKRCTATTPEGQERCFSTLAYLACGTGSLPKTGCGALVSGFSRSKRPGSKRRGPPSIPICLRGRVGHGEPTSGNCCGRAPRKTHGGHAFSSLGSPAVGSQACCRV